MTSISLKSLIWLLCFFSSNGFFQQRLYNQHLRFSPSSNNFVSKDSLILLAKESSSSPEAKIKTEGVSDEVDPQQMQNLYQKWEEDFLEEAAVEQLSVEGDEFDEEEVNYSKKKNKNKMAELPEYMLKMISKFDGGAIVQEMDPVPASKLPIVAIIGRPNTGKSTIVNKLTDTYGDGAIVHDEAGITRDRTYRTAMWNNYNFQVVDTGGIVFDDASDIFAEKITQQALLALGEATAAVMVVDGKEGVTQLDTVLADWLRKNNKVPLYVAVNKCESVTLGTSQAQDFWSLGLGEPFPVSGIHGSGLNDLLDVLTEKHMQRITHVLKENATNVAFIGRPNVGKSSLFNRIYGQERSIVSDVAGTTRDTIDALLARGDRLYRIIDTAGVRRRGKVDYGPEFFMVNRAFKAIKRAEVVVLLLDAIDGIVEQDRILAEKIGDDGRACVICLNKWDIVPNKDDKTYIKAIENIRSNMPSLRWADVLLVSAKTGQRTEKLFEAIDKAATQFSRRVSTSVINEIVQEATLWMAPPTIGSRSGRIYYTIQTSSAPPTMVMFCNDPALFTDNYKRYLERKIRDALGFEGTPIRMLWRGKSLRDVGRSARNGEGNMKGMMGNNGKKSAPKVK